MTVEQTLAARISRRSYSGEPLAPRQKEALVARMEQMAAKYGVRAVLVDDGRQAFAGLRRSYGMFSGVRSLIAFVCEKGDVAAREKIGFFGQLLVLEATAMGLGTCWVAGTFDRASCPVAFAKTEEIACVVTIGAVKGDMRGKEKLLYRMVHGKVPAPGELPEGAPGWYKQAVDALACAPSAVNRRPVTLTWEEGCMTARVPDLDGPHPFDLGIGKAQTALAAGGSWAWGNGGAFTKAEAFPNEIHAAVDKLLDIQR